MRSLAKNIIVILLMLVVISSVFSLLSRTSEAKIIPISQLVQEINQGKIKSITVSGADIAVKYNDGNIPDAKSKKETGQDITQILTNLGVSKEGLDKVTIDIK